MKFITRATSLYGFLYYCNQSNLEKNVLDCGAGSNMPPLAIFYQNGYKTTGIDNIERKIQLSKIFENKYDMKLNIEFGDMRSMFFDNQSFSFTYAYNSVFRMTKEDTKLAAEELIRVTRVDGLIYMNFLSVDDNQYGKGKNIGNHQFINNGYGSLNVHSFYADSEADSIFKGCTIICKEKKLIERLHKGEIIKQSFIEYIARVNESDKMK